MVSIIEEQYNWSDTNWVMQTPEAISVHHALAKACTAQDIHKWHLAKGWKGIAYHYFISKKGKVYRGRQEEHEGGAQYGSENDNVITICLEGCYTDYVSKWGDQTETEVPLEQLQALVDTCADIRQRRGALPAKKHAEYPSAIAVGKDCPGKYFPWDEFKLRLSNTELMQEVEAAKQLLSVAEKELSEYKTLVNALAMLVRKGED